MKVDKLQVNIYDTRAAMGAAAALDIKSKFCELLAIKPQINVIFAAAPSQNEVLASLVADKDIDWSRINAYHMDEYIGLAADAPQGFGNFLRAHIFDHVPLASMNLIDITAEDADTEAARYGALLDQNLADVVVMGIGENGHIAFNEPPEPGEICTEFVHRFLGYDAWKVSFKENFHLFRYFFYNYFLCHRLFIISSTVFFSCLVAFLMYGCSLVNISPVFPGFSSSPGLGLL